MSTKRIKRGFTLIELLVVVLIIGILAAVAFPQYQKAVVKSRASAMLPLVTALGEAQKRYFIENGSYADSFAQLDVTLPDSWQPGSGCVVQSTDCVSDGQWLLSIANESFLTGTIYALFASGTYKKGGWFFAPVDLYNGKVKAGLGCMERSGILQSYCVPVWKYEYKSGGSSLSFYQ